MENNPMIVINDFPPNIDKIKKVFNLEGRKPVFTYGNVLYNPFNGNITEELFEHESTHTRQQGKDIEGWWNKYLTDSTFRTIEELEAYSRQYIAYCKNVNDRNKRAVYLHQICSDISSEIYGNMIEYKEAMRLIRKCTKSKI